MYRLWDPIVCPLLRAAEPSAVCEIGAEAGAQTTLLLDLCAEIDAVAHVVDPAPQFDPDELARQYGSRLRFHRARSLDALPALTELDAVLVDGDHNWFTVFHELKILDTSATDSDRPAPLILLHDVSWPYGRRDMYYTPDDIPQAYRHQYAQRPVAPGDPGLPEHGYNAHLFNATAEGGPRNGVLTAVEDFVAQSSRSWRLLTVEAFHGLGVLVCDDRAPAGSRLHNALCQLESPMLVNVISQLDRARIAADLTAARWRRKADSRDGRAPAAGPAAAEADVDPA